MASVFKICATSLGPESRRTTWSGLPRLCGSEKMSPASSKSSGLIGKPPERGGGPACVAGNPARRLDRNGTAVVEKENALLHQASPPLERMDRVNRCGLGRNLHWKPRQRLPSVRGQIGRASCRERV